jgi:hypothetical protein
LGPEKPVPPHCPHFAAHPAVGVGDDAEEPFVDEALVEEDTAVDVDVVRVTGGELVADEDVLVVLLAAEEGETETPVFDTLQMRMSCAPSDVVIALPEPVEPVCTSVQLKEPEPRPGTSAKLKDNV